ncbi:ABC transporter ATP-binding protein [Amorphus sp. MBR-141]
MGAQTAETGGTAAANESGVVEISGVSHVYETSKGPTEALRDISFRVETGRFVSIVGPSGCGKSSLLMMVAGLIQPTQGEIRAGGRPLTAPDPSRIGVVFQDASLYPWLTARQNVEFPLSLRHVDREIRRERSDEALELVGLKGFEERHPHELSGGMKQRVALARGLVQDPPILLMDEPFAALDEQTRLSMGDEVLRIWDRTGKTILFVTHGLSEAIHLSDEVIVMTSRPGQLVDRVEVDLPRPRTFETLGGRRFEELRDRIWQRIKS